MLAIEAGQNDPSIEISMSMWHHVPSLLVHPLTKTTIRKTQGLDFTCGKFPSLEEGQVLAIELTEQHAEEKEQKRSFLVP